MAKANYIRVVIERAIHRELDYLVPETLSERVGVGSRVRVPFRERSALATVVAILDHSEAEGLRSIEAVIGETPTLSKGLLELAKWISTYYCCPIEAVMRSLLPQVIRHAKVGWKKQLFVRRSRKAAATRAAPGGTSGGDLAIGSAGARNRPSAPDISR